MTLLGTRYTVEQDFYRGRLAERHGLQVLVPGPAERDEVSRVIFEELVLGRIEPRSRARYAAIMDGLVRPGAQEVIAGCTEIALLVGPKERCGVTLRRDRDPRRCGCGPGARLSAPRVTLSGDLEL